MRYKKQKCTSGKGEAMRREIHSIYESGKSEANKTSALDDVRDTYFQFICIR